VVTGMQGGLGAGCPASTGCRSDQDCSSGRCDQGTHLCR
jgi:hypothetical protein